VALRNLMALPLLALAACATQSAPAPEAGYHGNRFSEPSRGVVVTLPTGWLFVAPEQLSVVKNAGADAIARSDPELASNAAAALLRTQILCMMVNAAGEGANRESITLATEPVSDSLLGMTTETYAVALRSGLRGVGYSVAQDEAPEPVLLSGLPFQAVHARVYTNGRTLYQTYYIRLQDDEVLSLIATHESWNRGEALLEIVRSFDLR